MAKKLLKFNIPEPLADDYDSLLGQSIHEYKSTFAPAAANNENYNKEGSVFDDPNIDFAFKPPEEPIETIKPDDAIQEDVKEVVIEEIISPEQNEIITQNIINEIEPIAQNETQEDVKEEIQEINIDENVQNNENNDAQIEPSIEEISSNNNSLEETEVATQNNDAIPTSEAIPTSSEEQIAIQDDENITPSEIIETNENNIETSEEATVSPIEQNQEQETQQKEKIINKAEMPVFNKKKKRKKRSKRAYTPLLPLIGGLFFTGLSILLLFTSLLAPLGYPFDAISNLGWSWVGLAIIGTIFWLLGRNWMMTFISSLTILAFLTNIAPLMGKAPTGSKASLGIGFANIEGSTKALKSALEQAKNNNTSLLIIAGANRINFTNISGWAILQHADEKDPASLMVISKEAWRAVTLPGEPTIVSPLDNSFTVIGIKSFGSVDDIALINRTANRVGDLETPTLAIGDFNKVPWDREMRDFANNSLSKRVLCGGYLGATYKQGIFTVPFTSVYSRDVKIAKCKIGSSMPQSKHKPIFVSVAQ